MRHARCQKVFPNLSQTRSEPTKIFSLDTWRVYLRVKILFRGGKFSSRREEELQEEIFSRNSAMGKLNPETGIHFLSENLLLIYVATKVLDNK